MGSRRSQKRRRARTYAFRKTGISSNNGGSFHARRTCDICGKWCYGSRREARDSAGKLHPGTTMRYYKCGDWWHFSSVDARFVTRIRENEAIYDDEQSA